MEKHGKANAFPMLLLKLQVGLRISYFCCLVWLVLIRFLGTAAISHARHDSCKVKLSSSMTQIHAYAGLLKRVLFNNVQTKRIKLTLMTFDYMISSFFCCEVHPVFPSRKPSHCRGPTTPFSKLRLRSTSGRDWSCEVAPWVVISLQSVVGRPEDLILAVACASNRFDIIETTYSRYCTNICMDNLSHAW